MELKYRHKTSAFSDTKWLQLQSKQNHAEWIVQIYVRRTAFRSGWMWQ